MCNLGDEIYNDGLSQGSKTMTQRINDLNLRLIEDNRLDDLLKSAKDIAYQEKLLNQFGI